MIENGPNIGSVGDGQKPPKRTWGSAPRKPSPTPEPDDLRAELEARAKGLIEGFLKPK